MVGSDEEVITVIDKVALLYSGERLSGRDVAQKLGIPYTQVRYIMANKLQISRTKSEARHIAVERYHPLLGKKLSTIHRQHISDGGIGREVSKETRQKIADTLNKHPVSETTRKKISVIQRQQFRNGERLPNTHAKSAGWFYTNSGIAVRSSWKLFICNLLSRLGINWEYEPQVFDLGFASYRPDLYLPNYNVWIEIKGYWRNGEREKVEAFSKLYPLLLIDEQAYQEIVKDNMVVMRWLVAMR